ncbi:hypothetical protein [Dyella sp. S184]|uniref:hypothetical protein n=1 Tax=Dyella sp. S184 TaxID=1641862 RepID=UPI001C208018|nr:hypothetical protein [Dyella sp. S184]
MAVEHYNFSSTGTGEYLGVGAGYNLPSNVSIGLSYDNYHAHPISNGTGTGVNVALYSVSAEYRF